MFSRIIAILLSDLSKSKPSECTLLKTYLECDVVLVLCHRGPCVQLEKSPRAKHHGPQHVHDGGPSAHEAEGSGRRTYHPHQQVRGLQEEKYSFPMKQF